MVIMVMMVTYWASLISTLERLFRTSDNNQSSAYLIQRIIPQNRNSAQYL